MPAAARHVERLSEALSIKYNTMVYELRERGTDVIVLSLGEAFFDLPLRSFDDLPHPDLYHYSHSRGLPALREQLAGYYGSAYGVAIDPASEIIITAGSKIAIHMSLMAILDPGDEVIVHEPAWVSYVEQVRLCHGVPVTVPHDVPVSGLGAYVTPRTKAIIVNNPNNPSGVLLSPGDWDALHTLARDRDLYLLSDEAYSEFVPAGARFISCGVGDPGLEHSIVCNSMSKNYGMSGWRLGYALTNAQLTAHVLKLNQHLVTCPATILSYYLSAHFDDLLEIARPQIRAVVEKRAEVARHLDRRGVGRLPGEATFYLFASLGASRLGSDEFCMRLLRDHGVCAVPGVGYGASCDHYIRISVGAEPMDRTLAGVDAIADLIAATSPRGSVVPAAA